ncbi:MAG: PIN domain-containing protein [Candidatus Devosia phytovorans]|uniref:PIN domain-containing protein n=1 Tax=Candidatus Devosia phytovorans TaxID=3121372 RepID=A0AAJ6B0H7_9HYPH|nr:PIN domain-containing protein [Devosia sp.]WEK04701.1 MAG: PIN domain-containing protein [Devosia sp.]
MAKPERKKSQTHILVDSSIWLDMAKDHRLLPVLDALRHLVDEERVVLIVPDIVEAEFARNKDRVVEDARRGFASHLKRVRDAVVQFAEDDAKRNATLQQISELDHRIAMKSEDVSESVVKIQELFGRAKKVTASTDALLKAAKRGIDKVAPFHLAKNSMADAVLIEIYAEQRAALSKYDEAAFVTSNVRDFSLHNGDQRKPHVDLEPLFKIPSFYMTSLVDVVKAADEDLLANLEFERNYQDESRGLSAILEAENLLFRQVWYNRHWNLRIAIEEGRHKVVPKDQYSTQPYKNDETLDTVWEGALAAAKRTEEEVGIENLGPWDDFEWGMVNGKLSALRWVLGYEWDMLDT